jgi:hypothetical protein
MRGSIVSIARQHGYTRVSIEMHTSPGGTMGLDLDDETALQLAPHFGKELQFQIEITTPKEG